jgi:7-cyano-7-deazaguanine synthase
MSIEYVINENGTSENGLDESGRPAVILLSGGLDSATCLAMASNRGIKCYALSVNYGQRHSSELAAAKKVAQSFSAELKTVNLDLRTFGGSALTADIDVPEEQGDGIPITYVPARNTIMLSLALAWAEVLGAGDIFIGVNAVDYSGYPDCRPEFINAYEEMANLATKAGVGGHRLIIHTPLLDLTKADIIKQGTALGVDYGMTVSCYQADEEGRACGVCDSCRIRATGFEAAGISDPTAYKSF